MVKFVYIFSTIGFALPIVIIILDYQLNIWNDYLCLMFWPSSIIMMATAREVGITRRLLTFYTGAIMVNIVLYAAIGAITWLGIHKNRFILYILVIAIGFGWYKMLMINS